MCTATPRLRWTLDSSTVAPPSLYCPLPAGIHADADAISAATDASCMSDFSLPGMTPSSL